MSNTELFGVHLLIDGYGGTEESLKNKGLLDELLHKLPQELGMHTISEPLLVEVGPMNHKDPGGISGVILIAESHISFHTFPKRGFITADVYTCKNELDSERIVERFKTTFGLKDIKATVIKRGEDYPTADLY